MIDFIYALHFIESIGLTLAVGSSTFALIFYFKAMEDHTVDASEKNFMHTVYFVLRIGMSLLVFTLLSTFLAALFTGLPEINSLLYTPVFFFKALLLFIILCNALLMDKHVMPMWLGPALAGGSWYSYFFAHSLTFDMPLDTMLICYVLFVAMLVVLLDLIRRVYLNKQKMC